jgi:hypothetical protein
MDQFMIIVRICLLLLGGGAFIGLYFFYLPKVLIRRLSAAMELEDVSFKSPLYSAEKPFFAMGTKAGYSFQCWVMRYHLFPVLELLLLPRHGDNAYDVFFLEDLDTNFLHWREKKELADRVNSIYVYESGNRRLISKILNTKTRDVFQGFIDEPVQLNILQNTMMLKYRCLPTYLVLFFKQKYFREDLVLFFKQKYFREVIDRIIRLSDNLLSDRNADLLLETMETETDTDLLILCLMLLFIEKQTDAVTAVFREYERHTDPVLRTVARCGLHKETYEDIDFLIKHERERERCFALENMPVFRLHRPQKVELLTYSLYHFDGFVSLSRALDSLTAVDRRRCQTVLYEYLTHKKQKREALGYLEKDYVIQQIGRHGYHKCFGFLMDFLQDEYDAIKKSCMKALASLGDIRAVPVLLPYSKSPYSSELKQAAATAIQTLQKDIPRDRKGSLSLSQTGQQGALSMEEEEKSSASGEDSATDKPDR